MSGSVSALYEPLISRDLESVAPAVRQFLKESSVRGLLAALERFAVLAYAPTEHARHAILAVTAADVALDTFPDSAEEILIACAQYAASSRLPWSEPPIPDPPEFDEGVDSSIERLRGAVAAGDRLAAERWLAANLSRADFSQLFFDAASEDLTDFGHKLTLAVRAWKLAEGVPAEHRFAVLRIAPWEWTAYRGEAQLTPASTVPWSVAEAVRVCIENIERGEEGVIDFHWLELVDAAVEVSEITGSDAILNRALLHLSTQVSSSVRSKNGAAVELVAPAYDLSRDYAGYLQSFSIGRRLERAAGVKAQRIIHAAFVAMASGPSFQESL